MRKGPESKVKRWELYEAAQNFGLDAETLSGRIKAAGIAAGKDKLYSTLQICAAVYGDLEGERILKTREERKKLERENAIGDRSVIPVDLVELIWTARTIEHRTRVMSANIPDTTKKDLLEPVGPISLDEYFKEDNTSLDATTEPR